MGSAKIELLGGKIAAVRRKISKLELRRVDAVEPVAEQHLGHLHLRDAQIALQTDRVVRGRVDSAADRIVADKELVGVVGFDVELMWRRRKQVEFGHVQRSEVARKAVRAGQKSCAD